MAVRDILPERISQRTKVPFFYGQGTHHAYRMLTRMLRANQGELIERALAAPGADRFINAKNVHLQLEELGDGNTDSPQVETLLRVVNMGLLSELVHESPRLEDFGSAPVLASLQAERSVSTSADEVGVHPAFHVDSVLVLNPGALLLVDPEATEDWYLLDQGQIEYVLSESTPTLRLIQGLDGTTTVKDLLATLEIEMDAVAEDLSELVGRGLVVRPRLAEPA